MALQLLTLSTDARLSRKIIWTCTCLQLLTVYSHSKALEGAQDVLKSLGTKSEGRAVPPKALEAWLRGSELPLAVAMQAQRQVQEWV
jgi:hypothetical protein